MWQRCSKLAYFSVYSPEKNAFSLDAEEGSAGVYYIDIEGNLLLSISFVKDKMYFLNLTQIDSLKTSNVKSKDILKKYFYRFNSYLKPHLSALTQLNLETTETGSAIHLLTDDKNHFLKAIASLSNFDSISIEIEIFINETNNSKQFSSEENNRAFQEWLADKLLLCDREDIFAASLKVIKCLLPLYGKPEYSSLIRGEEIIFFYERLKQKLTLENPDDSYKIIVFSIVLKLSGIEDFFQATIGLLKVGNLFHSVSQNLIATHIEFTIFLTEKIFNHKEIIEYLRTPLSESFSGLKAASQELLRKIYSMKTEEVQLLFSYFIYHPELLSPFKKLININFSGDGISEDTWNHLLMNVLTRLDRNYFLLDFERTSYLKIKGRDNFKKTLNDGLQHKPTIVSYNLLDLNKSGWSFLRFQGRSIVFKSANNSDDRLVVKISKKGNKNELAELTKQYNTVRYFKENKKSLNLISEEPTAICIAKIIDLKEFLQAAKKDNQFTEEQLKEFESCADFNDPNAYVYITDKKYLTYLHDPNISWLEFEEACYRSLRDVLTLFKQGIVYDKTADIFHAAPSSTRSDSTRDDGGRFLPLVTVMRQWQKGLGGLQNWILSILYVNFRATGIADEGDWEYIEEFISKSGALAKEFFSEAHDLHDTQAPQFISANFIAEFLFVLELVLGLRIHRLIHEHQNENNLELWKKGTNILKKVFTLCLSGFTGTRLDIIKTIMDSIFKKDFYPRQMQYWMTREHESDLEKNTVKNDVYESSADVNIDLESLYIKPQNLGNANGQHPIKRGDMVRHLWIAMAAIILQTKYLAVKLTSESHTNTTNLERDPARIEQALSLNPTLRGLRKELSTIFAEAGDKEKAECWKKDYSAAVIQNFWYKNRKINQKLDDLFLEESKEVANNDNIYPLGMLKTL